MLLKSLKRIYYLCFSNPLIIYYGIIQRNKINYKPKNISNAKQNFYTSQIKPIF